MKRLLLMVMLVSNFPLLIVGLGSLLLIVFIILIIKSRQKKTTAKEETSYSQVNDKPDDDCLDQHKNGSYIAMSPWRGEVLRLLRGGGCYCGGVATGRAALQ
uniref:Uncharacterized protein n=1 Tax=Anguilla anguilla TaxID=7936 RepID=A0A0E9WDQ3_ANGAN